ncbi:kinetochore protein NDC80 homolog isoform X2 [Haemaphysalis longicornis]
MDHRQSKPSTSQKSLATPGSQIPRRSSSADARPSMGPLTARSSRTSVRSAWTPAAGAGSRRSSSLSFMDVRLSQSAQRPASIKDARPFTDKAYLAESVEQLYSFLKDHAYPHHTTPQLLGRMSAREFENVFTFLVRFLEPSFQLGAKGVRTEDAVFERLRLLRYPYPLQKSTLAGIGSQPHKALAIITWLADAVKYFTTISPLENFFNTTEAPATSSPGFQMGDGNSAVLLRYCLESQEGDDHDKFLDGLVLDTFGPIVPEEELEKRLAEQQAELQRLTALVEEQDALEVHLEREKTKVKNFETYFAEMEQHFETRRAEVEKNEEAIKVINGQKEEVREQLCRQQALLQEQRGRQEDRQSLQQREQRLQQSLSAVRSELEALKGQQQLLSLSWYCSNEELQATNAKLQQSFARAAAPLRRVLPHSVLEDFDLRPVEDARSLQRHQACNRAALARANAGLEQAVQGLQASTLQEEELCDQYTFEIEDLQRQLQLKQELISKRQSYFATQTADKRKQAQELDEEYAELSKRYADLELKTMSVSGEHSKAVVDAKKRLADAQKRLADARTNQKETSAASDEERRQIAQSVKACYDEHLALMQQCHNKVIDAIKELQDIKVNVIGKTKHDP